MELHLVKFLWPLNGEFGFHLKQDVVVRLNRGIATSHALLAT